MTLAVLLLPFLSTGKASSARETKHWVIVPGAPRVKVDTATIKHGQREWFGGSQSARPYVEGTTADILIDGQPFRDWFGDCTPGVHYGKSEVGAFPVGPHDRSQEYNAALDMEPPRQFICEFER